MSVTPEQETNDKESEMQKTDLLVEDSKKNEPKKRSYYYDDACGYEIYQPEEDVADLD